MSASYRRGFSRGAIIICRVGGGNFQWIRDFQIGTLIMVSWLNENVHAKWVVIKHELTSAYPGKSRLPVRIRLNTYNGSVYVKIPRSFQGIILSQCWWGSTKLSAQVKAQVAYERDEGRIKRMFIGELDETDFSESSWSGDELNAETRYGNIYVKYEDEEEEPGFWSKLWGAIFFLSPS